jgi:hypothetical protein
MNTTPDPFRNKIHNTVSKRINSLSPTDISQIEHALEKAGPFGQVKLVVRKGKLCFIQVTQSVSVLPEKR